MSANGEPVLDHIVILVSETSLRQLPGKLEHALVVAEGGDHADGLTTNRLILFQDGVYIELIAFFDGVAPEKRKAHRWGRLREGTIIDWACTLSDESEFGGIQKRVVSAGAGYTYRDPVPGGRKKPDGTVLKWSIGSAQDSDGNATWPGHLPFWCLDRTSRSLRVPYENNTDQTQHPSGALGISRIVISVPSQELDAFKRVYGSIYKPAGSPEAKPSFHFKVPSGQGSGQRAISLSADDKAPGIKLNLAGGGGSPLRIELLPGLELEFES